MSDMLSGRGFTPLQHALLAAEYRLLAQQTREDAYPATREEWIEAFEGTAIAHEEAMRSSEEDD